MNSLSVHMTDGRNLTVRTTPGDIVRFERHFGVSPAALSSDPKLEHVMFIAYTALTRLKEVECTFDEFLDSVESMGEEPAPLA
ncbi:MAG: hypothetical protein QOE09_373 [Ilumatobacteraceae bacterium]|jgi:hypothetical protein